VRVAVEIGDLVEEFVGALDHGASMPFFTTIASKGVPRKNDWPTMVSAQAHDLAVLHRAAQAMHEERAVIAAGEIVLARPDQLDRAGSGRSPWPIHGELGREMLADLRAPAEAAAASMVSSRPSPGGRPRIVAMVHARSSGTGCRSGQRLGSVPFEIAVERLHRRMRQIGEDELGLDHLVALASAASASPCLPATMPFCGRALRYSAISSRLPRFSAALRPS
jgi:hypothetical protein